MGYLRYFDYLPRAQDANLKVWIANNLPILYAEEARAQAIITSRLTQKYQVETEFTNTPVFSESAIYKANSRVELYYSAWATGNIYTAGTYKSYSVNGNVYKCILLTTVANEPPTNTTYWTLVGAQYDLFYISYPYDYFDVLVNYNVGDRVFYKDKIYICQIASQWESHDQQLQGGTYSAITKPNVYPDDTRYGVQYWGAGTSYSVTGLIPNVTSPSAWVAGNYTAGQRVTYSGLIWKALINTDSIPGTDITSWQSETFESGDNRDQEIVMYYTDIVINLLMPRIAPSAVPKYRTDNYIIAMKWLDDAARGEGVTPKIKVREALKGNRIRWGSNVKQINGY